MSPARHVSRFTLPVSRFTFSAVLCLSILSVAHAQPVLPPVQDPLMSLMLSQPKIEFATQVVATATLDPPIVRPGELSIYRVSFNALEESVQWPKQLMVSPQLTIEPGAHGEHYLPSLGKLEPETVINSRVRASGLGKFTLPEFSVQVYGQSVKVPPVELEVVESPPPGSPKAKLLGLEFSQTNLYVGQAAGVRVILPGSMQFLSQVQLDGEGFIVDQSAQRQRVDGLSHSFVYE